jgi:predicted metal-dependent phosphoesterase TrpH
MTATRRLAWILLASGAAIGTWTDAAPARPPLTLGGYRVLAGDFHVHPHPLSAGTLAPWDLVLEARHQGLDVLAVTPHNGVAVGKWARWFADRFGGPVVIPGEEIHGPKFHMVALGTARYIDWRVSAEDAIDAIHRQGGLAIAAHPTWEVWPAYEPTAIRKLDGAEAIQPSSYTGPHQAANLRDFWKRSGAAAIGSSDYHGMGPLGLCRTYVFATDSTPEAVLDAIRARRTVATDGRVAYGLPEWTRYLPQLPAAPPPPSPIGAVLAVAGLAALIVTKS